MNTTENSDQPYTDNSVVDVGCGLGTWLWVLKEHGSPLTGFRQDASRASALSTESTLASVVVGQWE